MTLLQKVLEAVRDEQNPANIKPSEELQARFDELLKANIFIPENLILVSEKSTELIAQCEDEAYAEGFKAGAALLSEILSGQNLGVF